MLPGALSAAVYVVKALVSDGYYILSCRAPRCVRQDGYTACKYLFVEPQQCCSGDIPIGSNIESKAWSPAMMPSAYDPVVLSPRVEPLFIPEDLGSVV